MTAYVGKLTAAQFLWLSHFMMKLEEEYHKIIKRVGNKEVRTFVYHYPSEAFVSYSISAYHKVFANKHPEKPIINLLKNEHIVYDIQSASIPIDLDKIIEILKKRIEERNNINVKRDFYYR
jgi:hypothetical protein